MTNDNHDNHDNVLHGQKKSNFFSNLFETRNGGIVPLHCQKSREFCRNNKCLYICNHCCPLKLFKPPKKIRSVPSLGFRPFWFFISARISTLKQNVSKFQRFILFFLPKRFEIDKIVVCLQRTTKRSTTKSTTTWAN